MGTLGSPTAAVPLRGGQAPWPLLNLGRELISKLPPGARSPLLPTPFSQASSRHQHSHHQQGHGWEFLDWGAVGNGWGSPERDCPAPAGCEERSSWFNRSWATKLQKPRLGASPPDYLLPVSSLAPNLCLNTSGTDKSPCSGEARQCALSRRPWPRLPLLGAPSNSFLLQPGLPSLASRLPTRTTGLFGIVTLPSEGTPACFLPISESCLHRTPPASLTGRPCGHSSALRTLLVPVGGARGHASQNSGRGSRPLGAASCHLISSPNFQATTPCQQMLGCRTIWTPGSHGEGPRPLPRPALLEQGL